jgi:hypothetical protein
MLEDYGGGDHRQTLARSRKDRQQQAVMEGNRQVDENLSESTTQANEKDILSENWVLDDASKGRVA